MCKRSLNVRNSPHKKLYLFILLLLYAEYQHNFNSPTHLPCTLHPKTMKSQSNYQLPQHKPMQRWYTLSLIYSFVDDSRGREQCKWIKRCRCFLFIFSPPNCCLFLFFFFFLYFLQLNFIWKSARKISQRQAANELAPASKMPASEKKKTERGPSGRSPKIIMALISFHLSMAAIICAFPFFYFVCPLVSSRLDINTLKYFFSSFQFSILTISVAFRLKWDIKRRNQRVFIFLSPFAFQLDLLSASFICLAMLTEIIGIGEIWALSSNE